MEVATESIKYQILRERRVNIGAAMAVFRPESLITEDHKVLAPLHTHSIEGDCL